MKGAPGNLYRCRARPIRRRAIAPRDAKGHELPRAAALESPQGATARRTEVPPPGARRPFITDFLNDEHRVAIELDGVSHDGAAAYDARRSAYLNQEGYRVVRYNHDEVLEDLDAVLRDIARRCGRDVSEW